MKRLHLILVLVALLATSASAQFERTVAVTGSATVGATFELVLISTAVTRTIPFGPMATDYTDIALAGLFIESINDDYAKNGDTGFLASAAVKSDGKFELEATFVVKSTTKITEIRIGPPGGAAPAPRAPGIAYNPTFVDLEADFPTPFTGIQPQQPNAQLFLSGHPMLPLGDPALNFDRQVEVPMDPMIGGNIMVELNSGANANAGFALLVGPFRPTGQGAYMIPAPWSDVIEIGNPQPAGIPSGIGVVLDGLGGGPFQTNASGQFFAPYNVPFAAAAAQQATITAGQPLTGFQTLFADPTAPFNFSFSAACVPIYKPGRVRIIPVTQNGFAPVSFLPNLGFEFYGQTFNQLQVYENGLLSFGMAPLSGGGAVVDPQGVVTSGTPLVFVNWADYELLPATTGLSGIFAYEFGQELRLTWGEPGVSTLNHFGDGDSAQFEVTLMLGNMTAPPDSSAGVIRMDYTNLDPNAMNANDAVIGISPGMFPASPTNFDLGLSRDSGGFGAPLLTQSVNGGVAPASVLSVFGGGAPLASNGSAWRERSLTFFPPNGMGPLFDRYISIPDRARGSEFQRLVPGSDQLSVSAGGGQTLDLLGYFQYAFDAAGAPQATVVLDPMGPAPIPLTIIGVAAGPFGQTRVAPTVPILPVLPSQVRDFELLRVGLPPGVMLPPPGTMLDVGVQFASGAPMVVQNAVTVLP